MLLLIGLAVKYWYVALGILLAVVVIGLIANAEQRTKQLEQKRHRPGLRDPWLNQVAVALADLGLTEIARNTGNQLCGAAMEGDIGLQTDRFLVYVNLFADSDVAREAEVGLRAQPNIRAAVSSGQTILKTDGPVLYVAHGRGNVVDEFRLDEVVRTVGGILLPPSLTVVGQVRPAVSAPPSGTGAVAGPTRDALRQIQTLAELRDDGVLTDAEFQAKKADLLRRV